MKKSIKYVGMHDNAPILKAVTQEKMDRRSLAANSVSPSKNYSIADRVEEQANRQADAPFLIYHGKCFTYGDVNTKANQFAKALVIKRLALKAC
mgnify:CR=1 FL=1